MSSLTHHQQRENRFSRRYFASEPTKDEDDDDIEEFLKDIDDDRELSPEEVATIFQKMKKEHQKRMGITEEDERQAVERMEGARQAEMEQQQAVDTQTGARPVSTEPDIDISDVDSDAVAAEARKLWAADVEQARRLTLPKGAASFLGTTDQQGRPHGEGFYTIKPS